MPGKRGRALSAATTAAPRPAFPLLLRHGTWRGLAFAVARGEAAAAGVSGAVTRSNALQQAFVDLQEDLALEFEDFDEVGVHNSHCCPLHGAAAHSAPCGGQIFGLLVGDTEEVFEIFADSVERKVDALEARDDALPRSRTRCTRWDSGVVGLTLRCLRLRSSAPPTSYATPVRSTRRWRQSWRRCSRHVSHTKAPLRSSTGLTLPFLPGL